jgi:predicted CoA-binding protein
LQPLYVEKAAAIKCAEKGSAGDGRAYGFGRPRVPLLNVRGQQKEDKLRAEEETNGGGAQARGEGDWRENLITTDKGLRELLAETRRVAVLGIKTERQAYQPAFYVPQYLVAAGLEVVPVPVYYPEVTEIMGRKVYRKLADVPGPVDMVNVFRRSEDVPPHLEDILAAKPKSVWFQSGIRHDQVAEQLARAGIKVVQDLCLMVEHRALGRRG